MFRIKIIQREAGSEGINAKQRFRVKDARCQLEIRTNREQRRKTISDIQHLSADCILLTDVIGVGRISRQIQFAPTELLGGVTCTEIESVDTNRAKILEWIKHLQNIAECVARDGSRKQAGIVDDELLIDRVNHVLLQDFDPIEIGREAVCPTPPTVVWILRAGSPNSARVI